MAKKPAESEESEETGSEDTGSALESGSQVESGSEAASSASSAEASGDATGEVSDAASGESSGETDEQPKKKTASARISKRGSGTGKTAAVKATSTRMASPPPRGSGHELVPVICSECYEELVFDSGVASPVLTCPICEHQAARPDDAQLAVIAEKRKQESTNFKMGLILCVVSVVAFGVWIWLLRNPHTNANENGPAFYGPMAVSLLSYIGCLAFTLGKYEGARHDVYF